METNKTVPDTIDAYIATFPEATQAILTELRQVIHAAAPEAAEKISYQMPTFYLQGNLVHFAAFQHHIGLYPGASGVAAFTEKLADYKTSKGTIQFPTDQPLPYDLIREIVAFRVAENNQLAVAKKAQKKAEKQHF